MLDHVRLAFRAHLARVLGALLALERDEVVKRDGLRTEGKEYVVKDGDVLNFLFNV
ncbi:MAG: DUF933 domain-containing protein [Comamonadaceae bacterium]|nr:MAG: DUF933 domain-containing protein [Comamonadaceae bacterium]